jgi:sugar lactone lactonase YvrE
LALDRLGFLWISDSGNHTIRRLEPSGTVTTVAGTAGASAYTDATGSSARFTFPEVIDADSYGYAYVLSQNRIRRISPTGEVRTVVKSGPIIDGMGTTAGIQSGSGLAIGPHGDAFFGDVGTLRSAQRVVLRN